MPANAASYARYARLERGARVDVAGRAEARGDGGERHALGVQLAVDRAKEFHRRVSGLRGSPALPGHPADRDRRGWSGLARVGGICAAGVGAAAGAGDAAPRGGVAAGRQAQRSLDAATREHEQQESGGEVADEARRPRSRSFDFA